ncbi:hypothetical protein ACFPN7_45075 [Amycolatopsis halotolerans]|uniref:hypothetical protein n=1 Tax=Amycolatopsis halotolerans TaxID=330083 RepID=UPI0036149AC5
MWHWGGVLPSHAEVVSGKPWPASRRAGAATSSPRAPGLAGRSPSGWLGRVGTNPGVIAPGAVAGRRAEIVRKL